MMRRIDFNSLPVQIQDLLRKLNDTSERVDIRLNYANRLEDIKDVLDAAVSKFKAENHYV